LPLYKISYFKKEVNCTEPSCLVSVPWSDNQLWVWLNLTHYWPFYIIRHFKKEVNCTEPSCLVGLSWSDNQLLSFILFDKLFTFLQNKPPWKGGLLYWTFPFSWFWVSLNLTNYLPLYKISYFKMEVNCTEPSRLVGVPWSDNQLWVS
jgi:hypothetical protein